MLDALTPMAQSWNAIYSNHPVLRTGIGFAHIAALVGAGGCAIMTDRTILAISRLDPSARLARLGALHSTHRFILTGLAVIFMSGLLLLAADLDTYLHSVVFWVKIALVALLCANGAVIVRVGRRVSAGDVGAWSTLRYASIASLSLWFLTTLLGAGLPNV